MPRAIVRRVPNNVPRSSTAVIGWPPIMLSKTRMGNTNREIGDLVWISTNTVKFHVRNIYRKLEAERRTQAVENARSLGLIA